MNRKLLSLIAAIGLSLGSVSQITATPGAFFAALAAAAGVTHYRGPQIQQEQNKKELFDRIAKNYENPFAAQCSNGSLVQVLPDINTQSWRVVYIPHEALSNQSTPLATSLGNNITSQGLKEGVTLDFNNLTLTLSRMEEPETNETYVQYIRRTNPEKEIVRLRDLYTIVANDRIACGTDPVIRK